MGLNYETYYSGKRRVTLPRADEALKIAAALETTVEYLVSGKEPDASRKYRDALQKIQDITNKSL
jgi:hypothetical protein